MNSRNLEAFIVGTALGDGNLSNPNGRAVRLRITCDSKYQNIIKEISEALSILFPRNKVSLVKRKDNCIDISVYSNKLAGLIPWEVNKGSKYDQKAHVPSWIFTHKDYVIECLRGLILSDGSIYLDRKYLMINICTNIHLLAQDIIVLSNIIGYKGKIYTASQPSGKDKYTIRFAKNSREMLKTLHLSQKS